MMCVDGGRLVEEYLLFRGFTDTMRSFNTEIKEDRACEFQVDKVVEALLKHLTVYDYEVCSICSVHMLSSKHATGRSWLGKCYGTVTKEDLLMELLSFFYGEKRLSTISKACCDLLRRL